ncbi:MAG: amidohydrolase [Bifidobacteriaceae bacterium]|nr:amidohydrolase [Bifidobacteriaceae bacterium]
MSEGITTARQDSEQRDSQSQDPQQQNQQLQDPQTQQPQPDWGDEAYWKSLLDPQTHVPREYDPQTGYTEDQLRAIRHYLHQHPEPGFHEVRTTAYLARLMEQIGIPVVPTPQLGTGLIARIEGAKPGPRIALRADIDGLPVTEQADVPFASQEDGFMHACGHDLHMTYLIGAASRLATPESRANLAGTVDILFQPAEETSFGALRVISNAIDTGDADKSLDGTGKAPALAAIIGAHNMPDYQPDEIAVGKEPMMACSIRFGVTLHAQGSHGARPESGTGPIEAMATMITSLQTIVSRNISPLHPAVVSVTSVHAGSVWNVIPPEASFIGTARVFSDADAELVRQRFFTIVNGVAQAYGITADIDWPHAQPVMQSDPALGLAVADDVEHGGYATLAPIVQQMPGEDFAEFGSRTRVVFAFIGSNGRADRHYIHSPKYIGLDSSIPTGAAFYENAARRVLREIAAQ